jgi:hypothetical protein
MSRTRDIQAGVPQGYVMSQKLCNILYTNVKPQTPGGLSSLFADDTCIYATDRKEGYVLRKLQRGMSAGTSKSFKIKLRQSTFLIDLGHLRLILQ